MSDSATESARGSEQTTAQGDVPAAIEPRWPVALTVLFFIALTIALRIAQPHRETLGPS